MAKPPLQRRRINPRDVIPQVFSKKKQKLSYCWEGRAMQCCTRRRFAVKWGIVLTHSFSVKHSSIVRCKVYHIINIIHACLLSCLSSKRRITGTFISAEIRSSNTPRNKGTSTCYSVSPGHRVLQSAICTGIFKRHLRSRLYHTF